jgi:hypothetical protein
MVMEMKPLVLFLLLTGMTVNAAEMAPEELARIGKKVWNNECAGTVSGLTSWNAGEDFASLGIGHFIWYPAGKRGPFEESFPVLVAYLEAHGKTLPGWLHGPCPWGSRAEFQMAQQNHGERMAELRGILADTVPLQAAFLVHRMHEALPRMLAVCPPEDAGRVRWNFERMEGTAAGTFALIDYVNFKGEGTLPTERYNGQGWGLMQVLAAMPKDGDAIHEFIAAAKAMLERRVRNAPPERHEERWLPGWEGRLERYAG